MLDKLKAIFAAIIGFASFWVATKLGFEVSVELQSAVVGAIMYAVVYFVPNIDETVTPSV